MRLKLWRTNPTLRLRYAASRRSSRLPRSVPWNITRPDVGRISPPSVRSSVVFPDPDGPVTVTKLPGSIVERDVPERVDHPAPTSHRTS